MGENRERLHLAFWEISNVLEAEKLTTEKQRNLTTALQWVYDAFIELKDEPVKAEK